jgi:hypothetical protein
MQQTVLVLDKKGLFPRVIDDILYFVESAQDVPKQETPSFDTDLLLKLLENEDADLDLQSSACPVQSGLSVAHELFCAYPDSNTDPVQKPVPADVGSIPRDFKFLERRCEGVKFKQQ